MTFLKVITLFAHLILPAVFLLWILKSKTASRIEWLCGPVFVTGSYLLLIWRGGAGWGWFGYYWPYLFLLAFPIAVGASGTKRILLAWLPREKKFKSWFSVSINTVIACVFALGVPPTLTAKEYPTEAAVELLFPLKGGVFHIGHGGGNEAMNHHFPSSAQKYALDIVKLNEWGVRAKGLLPEELEKYAIFDFPVIAPCSGEIISSESVREDQIPPIGDKESLLGNHVIIFCPEGEKQGKNISVLLAHLKRGSLVVKTGDFVRAGDLIGKVGNTGNTSEPHLHVHAVAGRAVTVSEIADSVVGVPMIFDGEFLIRNDRVKRP